MPKKLFGAAPYLAGCLGMLFFLSGNAAVDCSRATGATAESSTAYIENCTPTPKKDAYCHRAITPQANASAAVCVKPGNIDRGDRAMKCKLYNNREGGDKYVDCRNHPTTPITDATSFVGMEP